MGLGRFDWRRIVTALGIGFAIEVLLFLGAPLLPEKWINFHRTQEPGWHIGGFLYNYLVKCGFLEGGMGSVLLFTSIAQGIVYGLVIYLLLMVFRKKRASMR